MTEDGTNPLAPFEKLVKDLRTKIKKEEDESKERIRLEQEKLKKQEEEAKAKIKEEEQNLEKEKEKFKEFMAKEKEQYKNIALLKEKIENNAAAAKGYCRLNVGGKIFEVSIERIKVKDSLFFALAGDQALGKETYFLDKDPVLFEKVLRYLRTGFLELEKADEGTLKILKKEFEYYSLEFPKSDQIIAHSDKNDVVPMSVIEERLRDIIKLPAPKDNSADSLTVSCNSLLLSLHDQYVLASWICPENPQSIELSLLYRGSVDGYRAANFHSLCNGHAPTVSVIQSNAGYLFGGYTTQAWSSRGGYGADAGAFVYSLTRKYKASVSPSYTGNAIYDHSGRGPSYGPSTIHISDNCNQSGSSSQFSDGYYLHPYTGYGLYYLSGNNSFIVHDIEVFEVKKVEKSMPSVYCSLLLDINELKMLRTWINSKTPESVKLELLYRGSRDGFRASVFHSKCNNMGPTISVIMSHTGEIFGGYASVSFTSSGNYVADASAFLFSVSKKVKCPVNPSYVGNAVYDNGSCLMGFGGNQDLLISDNCNQSNSSHANSQTYFQYPAVANYQTFLAGSYNFSVHEVEVFQVKAAQIIQRLYFLMRYIY
eukprot:TRINITY_DN1589_c0_g1_i1.p1 TRINITY_DN1589_c0_g1~~TRINITY_DN1589_c0_g1_i1.p1  ORF type:complete len:596 (-),score=52.56 TRINITY_DN1589_c0_g1_i1:302-2089(-)